MQNGGSGASAAFPAVTLSNDLGMDRRCLLTGELAFQERIVAANAPGDDEAMGDWRMLGVDACKSGWIGIALSEGMISAHSAAGIVDLVGEAGSGGPLDVIAIDIPIGLPDTGRRQADVLARKAIGPLWPSAFMTPVRPAMEEPDYVTAAGLSRRLAREGIPRQAFALQSKVLQVDRVRQAPHRVVEVHSAASFAQLAGTALHSASHPGLARPWGAGSWPGPESIFPMISATPARRPPWTTYWTLRWRPGPPCASFGDRRGPAPTRPNGSPMDWPAPSGYNAD
jgi:hypothetical protein